MIAAIVWALTTPRPDVLIAADGQTAAARGASGHWLFLQKARDGFAAKEWLAADGDMRSADSVTLKEGVRCDDLGCTARLRDGRIVAFALAADAFDEDCRRAVVVASAMDAPGDCKAQVIDRRALRRSGATALYADGDGFIAEVARPPTMDRPWARAALAASERQPSIRRPATPDATPRTEDIEPGD
jgi:competence protein ComEC